MLTHLRLGDLVRLLLAWVSASVALVVAAALLPGFAVTSWWCFPAAAAAAAVAGLLLRPVMVAVSARVGWVAVLPLALVGQAIVLTVGVHFVPGITTDSFATEVLASWIAATVGTLTAWLTTAGTDDALAASLLRGRPSDRVTEDPEVDGVVFVQIDGVPFPVLHWAIQAGSVPAIRSWVCRWSACRWDSATTSQPTWSRSGGTPLNRMR